MYIICKRKCYDANGCEYIIGNRYKWYYTDYVYTVPYDEKLYNIYLEINGEDIFLGTGTEDFIEFNFELEEELNCVKCICLESNNRRYKKGVVYKYVSQNRENVMYTEDGIWMGFVSKDFINKYFIDYSDYANEFLIIDKLFDDAFNR